MSDSGELVQNEIMRLARLRGVSKTICPSEVARSLWPDDWREHMQAVRDAATVLVRAGKIVVTQKGDVVDLANVRGPVRLGLVSDVGES